MSFHFRMESVWSVMASLQEGDHHRHQGRILWITMCYNTSMSAERYAIFVKSHNILDKSPCSSSDFSFLPKRRSTILLYRRWFGNTRFWETELDLPCCSPINLPPGQFIIALGNVFFMVGPSGAFFRWFEFWTYSKEALSTALPCIPFRVRSLFLWSCLSDIWSTLFCSMPLS